jgi:putative Holliday junction resolvase
MTRVLALDYGSASCGCAVSDPTGTLATPLDAVDRPGSEEGLRALSRLVRAQAVGEVVVGMPVGLSGAEGLQAAETRRFVDQLTQQLDVPVTVYDERFTTRMARSTPGRASEDSRAAAHLLSSFLESRARS